MSALISSQVQTAAIMGMLGVKFNDESLQRNDYRALPEDKRQTPVNGVDMIWPRSGLTGTGASALLFDNARQYWEWPAQVMTGVSVQKVFTGVTLNTDGTVNGGVTVQLFNTATGVMVDSVVSDAQGNYTMTDPNGVACFIVAYEAGSPDVAGTTKNNLTGS